MHFPAVIRQTSIAIGRASIGRHWPWILPSARGRGAEQTLDESIRAGRASAATTPPRTSSRLRGSVCTSSQRSPAAGPSGSGSCCTPSPTSTRWARSPATRPCRWPRPACKAIYLSGWQVAADANLAGQMYPDQSLYPGNSVPGAGAAINNAFRRADQIQHAEGAGRSRLLRSRSWPTPRPASAARSTPSS